MISCSSSPGISYIVSRSRAGITTGGWLTRPSPRRPDTEARLAHRQSASAKSPEPTLETRHPRNQADTAVAGSRPGTAESKRGSPTTSCSTVRPVDFDDGNVLREQMSSRGHAGVARRPTLGPVHVSCAFTRFGCSESLIPPPLPRGGPVGVMVGPLGAGVPRVRGTMTLTRGRHLPNAPVPVRPQPVNATASANA